MTPRRKKATNYIVANVGALIDDRNAELYNNLFKSMTDDEFDKFMVKLRDGTITLSVIVPPGSKLITMSKLNKFAKKIGLELYQHLTIVGDRGLPPYTTPNKYLITTQTVKRTAQLATKKIAISQGSDKTDQSTGQVTGASRASKITLPEVQLLAAMGLDRTIVELLVERGGDNRAKNTMVDSLYKTGRVNREQLDANSSGVVSATTLSNYLRGIHIQSFNLDKS